MSGADSDYVRLQGKFTVETSAAGGLRLHGMMHWR